MIELREVEFRYPHAASPVLSGLNLEVAEGEFLGLIGPNGSGKSTLARLLNGLLLPSAGSLTVDGLSTADLKALPEVRRIVGLVFQEPESQIVAPVVEEDVAFGPENLGLSEQELHERVEWAVERLELGPLRRSEPHLLSGGQKQRVAIAGVLAMQPRYLVLDEPTTMLDPCARREVLQAVAELRSRLGLAVVLVTHRLEEVVEADRLVVLEQGRIALEGPPRAVFACAERLARAGLELPDLSRLALELGLIGPEGALLHEDELCRAILERL